MIDRDEAFALVQRAIRASRATETEVTLGGGSLSVTRFANNHIHQNSEEAWPYLSVRVGVRQGRKWYSGRRGTFSTAQSDIRAAIEGAISNAKLGRVDEEYVKMAYPEEAGTWVGDARGGFDRATAESGPARRVHAVSQVVLPCRQQGLASTGQVSLSVGSLSNFGDPGAIAIGNSRGLFQYYPATLVSMSCTVQHSSGSTGWAEATRHRLSEVKPEVLAERATKKALLGESPRARRPGKYTVVLEPAAVSSLLWFLMPGFARQNFDEGRSLIGTKLGERIFDQHISLADDPLHPLLLTRPFDGEGVPTQRVELIRMGVPKGFLYSRRSAAKHKVSTTGHSAAQPSAAPERARGPVMSGGQGSVEDLVKETDRGLLVTRLWYNRYVGFRGHQVTGMTRDGLFAIEGGTLVGPVQNMRYNVSLIDVLRAVKAMGKPVRAGGMVVPPLKVAQFNFTGTTHF